MLPDPETLSPVTSILSTVESSEHFLIFIRLFPLLSASTASEKVRVILPSTSIPVASSVGEDDVNIGAMSITW